MGELNLGAAVFVGKQLSFELDLRWRGWYRWACQRERSSRKARAGGHSASSWFNERFGLSLPLYSETNVQKTTIGGLETKQTVTNNGIGLFAAFRFRACAEQGIASRVILRALMSSR